MVLKTPRLRNREFAMGWQDFLDVGIAVVSGLFGWFFKVIWEAINELKADMKTLNVAVHEKCVMKDDYRIEMAKIEAMFQRIMDKLDGKADKP